MPGCSPRLQGALPEGRREVVVLSGVVYGVPRPPHVELVQEAVVPGEREGGVSRNVINQHDGH